jgi:hypothetical protein
VPDFPVTPVTASVSPAGPLQALGLKDGNVFFNGIDSLVLIEDETGLRRTRVNQGAGRDGHDSLTAAGIRFCIAVFRTGLRHRRRAGHRFRALHPRALLFAAVFLSSPGARDVSRKRY